MRKMKDARRKRRNTTLGLTICCVAAIAVIGAYTVQTYKTRLNENLREAKKEVEKLQDEDTKPAESLHIENEEPEVDSDQNQNGDDTTFSAEQTTGQEPSSTEETTQTGETAGAAESLSFGEDSKLLWPVDGTVLMDYSMDKTVYFKTLDQYKYNPALIISGAVGDQVISSCRGMIKSIDNKADTGGTVTVDVGSGYELLYGQLKDVAVQTGEYVDAATVIGYVNDPTIYYGEEGSNVYFEMRRDGQPIDPEEYLTAQSGM